MRHSRERSEDVGGENDAPAYSPFCASYGCQLSGAISHSTLGGGPWYCRFHFGREPSESDAITFDIRKMKASGELDGPRPDTATVTDMRTRLITRKAAV